MSRAVRWQKTAIEGRARAGVLTTPHGDIATPNFMPVGTRGTVKTVDSGDLENMGAAMLLANTYHLMLRPGEMIVERLGGLHGFMSWPGPTLTDSGGYQVFSLSPEIDEDGVVFRSVYDGSRMRLTPERAIDVQEKLGADIAMALDVLVGLPSPAEAIRGAMERTLRWADRAIVARAKHDQGLFGIVQGGTDVEMRLRSAAETAARDFDGYGLGGFSVGESGTDRAPAMDAALSELPEDKIRYVMGLGDTEGLLDAIWRGADLFDCVLPTRLARHGKVLHPDGDFSIRNRAWAQSDEALEDGCRCPTCLRYARGYVRHLFSTKEPLGPRLVTLHNLTYTLDLVAQARSAIEAGGFAAFHHERLNRRLT
jgi:queuine tRNA-ribosyltransferase